MILPSFLADMVSSALPIPVGASWSALFIEYSSEMLCYRLGLPEERLADCGIALDVLSELGIIILKEGKYILPSENIKVSLENSSVFRCAYKCRNEQ